MGLNLRRNTYLTFFKIYIDNIPVLCTLGLWVAGFATKINGALHLRFVLLLLLLHGYNDYGDLHLVTEH